MVIVGLLFLFVALYTVGSQKNLFGKGFTVSADFKDVNGLMAGNNVRFAGIDVGTVKAVEIINDTTVHVTMIIRKDAAPFIKKNALVRIGTDGLMGNKLVNIFNQNTESAAIEQGDILKASANTGIEGMTEQLSNVSADVSVILGNIRNFSESEAFAAMPSTLNDLSESVAQIRQITEKVNASDALWSTLQDKQLAANIRQIAGNLDKTAKNAADFSKELQALLTDIKSSDGTLQALIYDERMANDIKQSMSNISKVSEELTKASESLATLTQKLNSDQGAAGKLLNDATFADQMGETMEHIRNSSVQLEEHMEALKSNFLFRRYYRKQERGK